MFCNNNILWIILLVLLFCNGGIGCGCGCPTYGGGQDQCYNRGCGC